MISRMKKQQLTRFLFLLAGVWLVATSVIVELGTWPFEWSALAADIIGLLFVTVLLPLFLDRPHFHGTLLTGEFYPLKGAWPVWLFWLAMEAMVFHAALAIRLIIIAHQLDYHLIRATLVSLWLALVYSGKITRWRPAKYCN